MKTIDVLLESISKYLKTPNKEVSNHDIIQLLENYFLKTDSIKFSLVLSNRVVEPLSLMINQLNSELETLGKSMGYRKERKEIKMKIKELNGLLYSIFDKYSVALKDDKHYKAYQDEKLAEITKIEQALLEGNLDDGSLASILYPTSFDAEKTKTFGKLIASHFASLYLDPKNHEYVKTRLKVLHGKIQESVGLINKSIEGDERQRLTVEKSIKNLKEEDIAKVNENDEEFNLKDHYIDSYASLSFELNNLNKHKEILLELFNELSEHYPFLNQVSANFYESSNVFGDSNFEKVKNMANDIKQAKLVNLQTTVQDLIDVFTQNDSLPKAKINFTNGTLNDYGYLMSKMRQFFIDSISNKSNYAQWWSERFTFNLKDKDKKEVSNMISAVNKNAERRPSMKQSITEITKNLDPIPQ